MGTRICTSCGEKFNLTDSEIAFYNKKGLSLPKKCENCRKKTKAVKERKEKNEKVKLYATLFILLFTAVCFFAGIIFFNSSDYQKAYLFFLSGIAVFLIYIFFLNHKKKKLGKNELYTVMNEFRFRFSNAETFKEHFEKHGAETKSRTPRKYLENANRVITSRESLKKREKEDGDEIYYDINTDEIVFVSSKSGFIRTYYIADYSYYLKQ